jgi:hypothetical protein
MILGSNLGLRLLNVDIDFWEENIIRLDYGNVVAVIFQDGHYEVFNVYLTEEREKFEDLLDRLEKKHEG